MGRLWIESDSLRCRKKVPVGVIEYGPKSLKIERALVIIIGDGIPVAIINRLEMTSWTDILADFPGIVLQTLDKT